jgi:hypothetical protein
MLFLVGIVLGGLIAAAVAVSVFIERAEAASTDSAAPVAERENHHETVSHSPTARPSLRSHPFRVLPRRMHRCDRRPRYG